MIEPIYSSHGGAEKGYRCKVLVGEPTRECGKLCKSYWGAQRHGWLIHHLRIQMELYDAEKIQEQSNEQFSSAVRNGDSDRTIGGELFAGEPESDSERDRR